jgi:hypothetical protein
VTQNLDLADIRATFFRISSAAIPWRVCLLRVSDAAGPPSSMPIARVTTAALESTRPMRADQAGKAQVAINLGLTFRACWRWACRRAPWQPAVGIHRRHAGARRDPGEDEERAGGQLGKGWDEPVHIAARRVVPVGWPCGPQIRQPARLAAPSSYVDGPQGRNIPSGGT